MPGADSRPGIGIRHIVPHQAGFNNNSCDNTRRRRAAPQTLTAPAPRLWLTLHNLSPTDGAPAFLPRGDRRKERTVSELRARLIGQQHGRSCLIAANAPTANHG